jgi:Holliday junction DNA helicase RuvB
MVFNVVTQKQIRELIRGYIERGEWDKADALYIWSMSSTNSDDYNARKCFVLKYGSHENYDKALSELKSLIGKTSVSPYEKTEDASEELGDLIRNIFEENPPSMLSENVKSRVKTLDHKAIKVAYLLYKEGRIKSGGISFRDTDMKDALQPSYKALFNEDFPREGLDALISSGLIIRRCWYSRKHEYYDYIVPIYAREIWSSLLNYIKLTDVGASITEVKASKEDELLKHEKILEIVKDLLDKDPSYKQILERAISYEDRNEERLGWEWYDVCAEPRKLIKLITIGLAKINYKSRSATHYRLTDRAGIKKALELIEVMEGGGLVEQKEAAIPENMFELITGYDDIKWVILQSLRTDKPVHVLLVGPPATAKSLFLMDLERLEGSRYVLGGSATKAGITRFIIEEKPKYLLIDELDKMRMEDYSALLSLMESGVVTELKAGRRSTVKLKCWVFAAANREDSLPPELRSRFTCFKMREYSAEEFQEVAYNVLTKREGINSELAHYIVDKVTGFSRDVRDCVKVARLAKTKEDVDKVVTIFLKYRYANI